MPNDSIDAPRASALLETTMAGLGLSFYPEVLEDALPGLPPVDRNFEFLGRALAFVEHCLESGGDGFHPDYLARFLACMQRRDSVARFFVDMTTWTGMQPFGTLKKRE